MKKILFVGLLTAVAARPAVAQTDKGAKYLGVGVGGLNYSRSAYSRGLSATLFPSAGLFVADNVLLGTDLRLGYAQITSKYPRGSYAYRTVSYGLAPFARFYVPSTSRHRFFGQLSVGATWTDMRTKLEGANVGVGPATRYQHDNYQTAGLALGYNYFLSPHAALEVTAGYALRRYNNPVRTTGAFDIRAGFSIFLPSKKSH